MNNKEKLIIKNNKIYNIDCLEGMDLMIEQGIKVDMILCDLPYGTTSCKWDTIIPFDKLWERYSKLIKDNGAIVLFAAQPFTTKLIYSNIKDFKYCWYWIKNSPTGFAFSKNQPLRNIEDICIFYKNKPTYNPQGLVKLDKPKINKRKSWKQGEVYGTERLAGKEYETNFKNYPRQTLIYNVERGLHPTQKPTALLEYLIKTYTNENELILDNCIGSGSTAVACINQDRQFI